MRLQEQLLGRCMCAPSHAPTSSVETTRHPDKRVSRVPTTKRIKPLFFFFSQTMWATRRSGCGSWVRNVFQYPTSLLCLDYPILLIKERNISFLFSFFFFLFSFFVFFFYNLRFNNFLKTGDIIDVVVRKDAQRENKWREAVWTPRRL